VRSLSIRPVARNAEAIALFAREGFDVVGHVELFTVLDDDAPERWRAGIDLHGRPLRY